MGCIISKDLILLYYDMKKDEYLIEYSFIFESEDAEITQYNGKYYNISPDDLKNLKKFGYIVNSLFRHKDLYYCQVHKINE